jgi:hypothetical protein
VVDLFWMERHFLGLTLYPGLGECRGEEGRAVEDEAVQVVSLAKGNESDVGVPSFTQAASVEVVGQGYRIIGSYVC